MNKSKKMSTPMAAVLLSLILLFTTAGRPLALTEQEMRFKIEAYIAAEKADDYETMARLLGKDAEELQQGLGAYTESLKLRFAQTMGLNFTGVSFGEHRILFIRPEMQEAYVGQQSYAHFRTRGSVQRRHEYSIYHVGFDEGGRISWRPLAVSVSEVEELGKEL